MFQTELEQKFWCAACPRKCSARLRHSDAVQFRLELEMLCCTFRTLMFHLPALFPRLTPTVLPMGGFSSVIHHDEGLIHRPPDGGPIMGALSRPDLPRPTRSIRRPLYQPSSRPLVPTNQVGASPTSIWHHCGPSSSLTPARAPAMCTEQLSSRAGR